MAGKGTNRASEGAGFHELVGVQVDDAGEGHATVSLKTGDHHLNRHGTVHGGCLATLADTAMGAAVAASGQAPVTVEMTMTYLEPAGPGTITASARIRRQGKRITIVEAEIVDDDGEDVAHAIATFTGI
ncbi:MAG TPA: PaaI family thioesterase [Aquihabitans sp.]|jgi:acyl-CoA thioesterase|nr:PaaI family thioesterase [Aquihabitans sp.]